MTLKAISPALTSSTISSSGQAVDVTKLTKWRIARAKAYARTYSPKILCIGDSIMRGAGSRISGADLYDSQRMSMPSQLARLLTAQGLPAIWGNFCGDAASVFNNSTLYPVVDPRVTLGAGWAANAATFSAAGGFGFTNSTNTNSLAFVPEETFDTIVVQYVTNTGLGTFTVDIDGGAALATLDTSLSISVVQSAEIACSLGTHTVNIKRTGAGGAVFINGISCYQKNANVVEVQMLGAGIYGGQSTTELQRGLLATHPTWGRDKSYIQWAPDLTIIMVGYNDSATGTAVAAAAFQANLETLVDSRITTGDKMFLVWPPSNPASRPLANQILYRNAIRNVALGNSLICIDFPLRYGEYAAPYSDLSFDGIHMNGAGYGDMANLLASTLLA